MLGRCTGFALKAQAPCRPTPLAAELQRAALRLPASTPAGHHPPRPSGSCQAGRRPDRRDCISCASSCTLPCKLQRSSTVVNRRPGVSSTRLPWSCRVFHGVPKPANKEAGQRDWWRAICRVQPGHAGASTSSMGAAVQQSARSATRKEPQPGARDQWTRPGRRAESRPSGPPASASPAEPDQQGAGRIAQHNPAFACHTDRTHKPGCRCPRECRQHRAHQQAAGGPHPGGTRRVGGHGALHLQSALFARGQGTGFACGQPVHQGADSSLGLRRHRAPSAPPPVAAAGPPAAAPATGRACRRR